MPGGEVRIAVVGNGSAEGRVVAGLAEPGCRGVVIMEAGGGAIQGRALARAVEDELARGEAMPGAPVTRDDPAGPEVRDLVAWANTRHSLLVVLSPDGTPWRREAWQDPWLGATDDVALPALPLGLQRQAPTIFPAPLARINCVFWRADVADIVPVVLARLGLALETPRIFISYRRGEAQALADQLFHALAEIGFDTFLDCFRLTPGVDFQRRLKQELGDKSVVLVLESAGILLSEWTRYEIDTAKLHQLGLVGLLMPGGVRVPSIDESRRLELVADDFEDVAGQAPADLVLGPAKLAEVVTHVVAEHDRALRRRALLLRLSVQAALQSAGWSVDLSGGPFLPVSDRGGTVRGRVWVCDRPPALPDFHAVDLRRAAGGQEKLMVVGLMSLMEQSRLKALLWLEGVSNYALFDTDDLVRLAAHMGPA